ncbi:MAG: glyoxalase [Rhodospirillaceae bacterium]|nr:glyoxalase [Rhodospirillaceae bacterium]
MHHTGIERVTYGVDDLEVASNFWNDFGLKSEISKERKVLFSTLNGAEIELTPYDLPNLPPPVGPNKTATMREVTFGVASLDDIYSLQTILKEEGDISIDADGTLHGVDPMGFGIAFRPSKCKQVIVPNAEINIPGNIKRLNRRGQSYSSASPLIISHIAFMTDQLEPHKDFYIQKLGFKLTDSYPGRGYFMRCADANNHHNVFLLDSGAGKREFHHLAFELGSIHEFFGGGNNMTRKGWDTMMGPGRHPISSCYFWYFKNPCGGAAEYDFDSDVVDDDWVPREWASTPENFAEWNLGESMGEALLNKKIQGG